MIDYPVLSAPLRDRVLSYLGYPLAKPSTQALNNLLIAYVQKVPWESVFRLAKQQRTPMPDERPRWPEEFWLDAIERGGGGTALESNYAFLALLCALGYEGYLTINDREEPTGGHSAIILQLNGQKRLVDVGIPLYTSLRLDETQSTRIASYFHTYIAHPKGDSHYTIERTNHPNRYLYTLLDQPVPDTAYRAALRQQEYGQQALLSDRIIINKVIEGKVWHFDSSDHPLRIEAMEPTNKTEILLPESLLARRLASYFAMDRTIIQLALDSIAL